MVKKNTASIKKILRKHSKILIAFLFLISMTITPVIAKVSSQQNAFELTTQAAKFYQSRNWQEAANFWQEAADIFASQEDKLNQAMALSNLSLTYQQLGKWQEAKIAIEESISILKTQPPNDKKQLLLS